MSAKPGADGGGAVGEQPHGVALGERVDEVQHLPGDAERLAAGGQHPQPRAGLQQVLRERGDGVDQVLAVVEHQQDVVPDQRGDQPDRAVLLGLLRRAHHELGAAHRREQSRRELLRLGERRQLRDVQPGGACGARPDRLPGQPRLACAAGPGQRDEAMFGEQGTDPADVACPAHEAAEPRDGALRRGRGHGPVYRHDLAAQHGQPRGGQLRAGVDAELTREPGRRAVQHGQRLGLATGGVQPAGEQRGGALAQGIGVELRRERVELGFAAFEGELGAPLHRDRAAVGQPCGHGACERQLAEVGERGTAPQRQRLPERTVRGGRVGPSRVGDELAEAQGVDVRGVETQPVAARVGADQLGADGPPQPRDQRLQCVARAVGGRLAPEVVDEDGRGDRASGVEGEAGQQPAQP